MILTKKELKEIQKYMGVAISAELVQELLNKYGHPICDDEGHVFEFTEQDIFEQVKKILQEHGSEVHSTYVNKDRSLVN